MTGMGALLKNVISRLTSIMHLLLSMSHRMNKNLFQLILLFGVFWEGGAGVAEFRDPCL